MLMNGRGRDCACRLQGGVVQMMLYTSEMSSLLLFSASVAVGVYFWELIAVDILVDFELSRQ